MRWQSLECWKSIIPGLDTSGIAAMKLESVSSRRARMTKKQKNLLWKFVQEYCVNARQGFEDRWAKVKPDIYEKQAHEAIGGLLSRQATLTIELAKAPSMWNGHVAPLILRCMTDAYITLAWILDKP